MSILLKNLIYCKKEFCEKNNPVRSSSYNGNVGSSFLLGEGLGMVMFCFILKEKYLLFVLNNDQLVFLLVQIILFDISGGMTYSSEALKL